MIYWFPFEILLRFGVLSLYLGAKCSVLSPRLLTRCRPGLFLVSSARSGASLSGWHLLPTHRWKGVRESAANQLRNFMVISCNLYRWLMVRIMMIYSMRSSDGYQKAKLIFLIARWRSSPNFMSKSQSDVESSLMDDSPMWPFYVIVPGRSVLLAPISGMSDTRTRRCRRLAFEDIAFSYRFPSSSSYLDPLGKRCMYTYYIQLYIYTTHIKPSIDWNIHFLEMWGLWGSNPEPARRRKCGANSRILAWGRMWIGKTWTAHATWRPFWCFLSCAGDEIQNGLTPVPDFYHI